MRGSPALILVACASRLPPPEAAEPEADTASSAPSEESGLPVEWSIEDIPLQVEDALADGLPLPGAIRAAYLELIAAGGDDDCPGSTTTLEPPAVSLEGCASAAGYHFSGTATVREEGGTGQSWWQLSCDCQISPPDEEPFVGGGQASVLITQAPEGSAATLDLQGSFLHPASGGWLARGVSSYLAVSAGEGACISGGLTIGGIPLFFDPLEFDTLESDAGCAQPSGRLRVRDPSGAWWDLDLPPDCSGCGELSVSGDARGTACVDLSGLVIDIAAAVEAG